MNVVVLADTHLTAGLDRFPPMLMGSLRSADVILHAGDVVSAEALAGLRELAPVHAVLGNNDHDLAGVLPEQLSLALGGVRVALLHDSGAAAGRARRMSRRFPEEQLVIFGHSHIPVNEPGIGNQVLFNPGSPTQRRTQRHPTFGTLCLSRGRIRHRAIETIE